MKVENASFTLLFGQSNSSLCNKLHKSLQSIEAVKAEGSCEKIKGLNAGNKREWRSQSRE